MTNLNEGLGSECSWEDQKFLEHALSALKFYQLWMSTTFTCLSNLKGGAPKNDNFIETYLNKMALIKFPDTLLFVRGRIFSLWSSDCCLPDLHCSDSAGHSERDKPEWWEHSHWLAILIDQWELSLSVCPADCEKPKTGRKQSEDQRECPNIFLWNYHFWVNPPFKET